MIRVGLTGNMGCGKSTVARMFADLGAETVDADALVHELLASNGAAVEPVLAVFPEAAADAGRAVDRARLAAIVFADPGKRRQLERIVHPLVWQRTRERMEQAQARGADMVVVEATLLFEAARGGGPDPRGRFDAIVVVTCDPAVQLERLRARLPPASTREARLRAEEQLRARLAAQLPQDEKARLADHVVDDSGDEPSARRQVQVLHSLLVSR